MKKNLIIGILVSIVVSTSLYGCNTNETENKHTKSVAKFSNDELKKIDGNVVPSEKKGMPFYDCHGNNLYGPLKYDEKQVSNKKLKYIEVYNYCDYIYNNNYCYKDLVSKYIEYCEKNKDNGAIEFNEVLKKLDKETLDKYDDEKKKRKDAGMRIKSLTDKKELNWRFCKDFQESNIAYKFILSEMEKIKDPKKITDIQFGKMVDYTRDDQGKVLDRMRSEIDKME